MLDLNYVRENLDKVRAALQRAPRGYYGARRFRAADAERRRIIAESDQLNAERNAASREIGGLMKEGKKEEAEARREEVNESKGTHCRTGSAARPAETRMHDLLSTLAEYSARKCAGRQR